MTQTIIGKYTVEINEENLTARAYSVKKTGRIQKKFHYRFRTLVRMNEYLEQFKQDTEEAMKIREDIKRERKEARTDHGIEPGQVYYTSWGYDQTNVYFFLVTKVSGQKITYVEVGQSAEHTGFMSGRTQPDVTKIVSKEMSSMATGKQTFNAGSEGLYTKHYARLHQSGETHYFSYYG